ncbi:MAG: hypothetical protein FJW90_01660, partial [Actinobacteria bacterium]|nr:hypothetical protein [Actinomycetota bacterium]
MTRRAAQRRDGSASRRGGRRSLVLAMAALAAVALGAIGAGSAAAAQTVKKGVWGLPTTLNGRSLFPTYKDLGFGVYNMQARWDGIAPTQPADPTDPND